MNLKLVKSYFFLKTKMNWSYNEYIWFKIPKWKGIEQDIVTILYKNYVHIISSYDEIKKTISTLFKIDIKILNWIDTFNDKNGKYFYHQIRNAQQSLKTKNFLIKNNGWSATNKLLKVDTNEIEKRIESFWVVAKNIYKNKIKNIKYVNEELIRELKKYKIDKSLTKEEINKQEIIIKLRYEFKKRIDNQRKWYRKKIKKRKNTYINFEFPSPERSHILPVYFLYKNNRLTEIANPNNGLFLDPNTHRLFDQKYLKFNSNYDFVWVDTNIIYRRLDKKILTPERKEYINEYMQIFKTTFKKIDPKIYV